VTSCSEAATKGEYTHGPTIRVFWYAFNYSIAETEICAGLPLSSATQAFYADKYLRNINNAQVGRSIYAKRTVVGF
jgi:hypothetical protein